MNTVSRPEYLNATNNKKVFASDKKPLIHDLKKDRWLYIMMILPLVHILVFSYLPIYGITIAFMDFNVFLGYFNSKWVWFSNFERLFNDGYFWKVFFNTLKFGASSVIFGFPAPIILALLLNEVKKMHFKKTVQTLTYLPYFIPMVAICTIIIDALEPQTGVINNIIEAMGGKSVYFITRPEWFLPVYITTGIWQEVGFGTIIYLAALSSIDPNLYEAAIIDGAGRFRQAINITIPLIMPTIMILLILNMPSLISANFEKILLLYRPITYEVADVVPTYIYRKGLLGADYSYTTAVGMFQSVLNLGLVVFANKMSKMAGQTSLW